MNRPSRRALTSRTDYNSGTEPNGDIFPAPAPVGPLASSLAVFNSTDPNGTWSLFIHDDEGVTVASLPGAGNHDQQRRTGESIGESRGQPDRFFFTSSRGELLTYTISAVNLGPSNASSIVISNRIPAIGASESANSTQGTISYNDSVIVTIPTLASGASAVLTIVVRPNGLTGSVTSLAHVSSDGTDNDPANNNAVLVTTVTMPVANLALSVTASPATLFVSNEVTFVINVTNRGPNRFHCSSHQCLASRLGIRLRLQRARLGYKLDGRGHF